MGLFGFRKKSFNSDEYEKVSKRITDLENTIDKIASKLMSLRGLIHRKATGDFDLEPENIAGANIKSNERIDDGFDELRKLKKE